MTKHRQAVAKRRRVLRLLAGAAALGPLSAVAGTAGAAVPQITRWRGVALGAAASLEIHHPDRGKAEEAVALVVAELQRLERIFSLYRRDSALTALNREGELAHPPLELVDLLYRARLWSERSRGAFDVTVQPLWQLYRAHFAKPGADPAGPKPDLVARTRARVGYDALEIGSRKLRLGRRGMAVTLNGIAQGYITDRLGDLLRGAGFENLLLDFGEIGALGTAPAGRPWHVGLEGPEGGDELPAYLEVRDGAVATSSPQGTLFDAEGHHHHLFDPATGRSSAKARTVHVLAKRAVDADACATALAASPAELNLASLPNWGVEQVLVRAPGGGLKRPLRRNLEALWQAPAWH